MFLLLRASTESMAAADVIIVNNSASFQCQKGAERIERLLESWCKDLRAKVVNEFIKYKSSIENEQQRTISEIQSKPSPEVLKLRRDIEKLRELLHTLEKSVSQKDELVSNLVKSLEKEKEKYEKLRAVSNDQWERSAAEESDEDTAKADKRHTDKLLSRCWTAWKNAARRKNVNDALGSEAIVEVKQENSPPADNPSYMSRDRPDASDEGINQFAKSATAIDYGATAKSDDRTYPAYQTAATKGYSSIDATCLGQNETASFAVLQSTQEDNESDPNEAIINDYTLEETNNGLQGNPAVSNERSADRRVSQKARGKKRVYARTVHERGKKMYEMKDKIRIKKVQSLKGRASFLTADERPTMATNAFQPQTEESNRTVVTHPQNFPQTSILLTSNQSYSSQDLIGSGLQSVEPIAANLDLVKPPLGPNHSDWETAKNNISQYMNQMLNKSIDTKEASRSPTENRPVLATTSGIGETLSQGNVSGAADQMTGSGDDTKAKTEGHLCTVCDHVISPWSFKKHKRTCKRRNPTSNEKWTCKDCGKSFISGKRYLEDHILSVHMGTSPYECSVCGRGFASYNNYKRHLLVHSGDRPFECSICRKRFNQYCNLARHRMRIHNISKEEALFLDLK